MRIENKKNFKSLSTLTSTGLSNNAVDNGREHFQSYYYNF